MLKSRIKDVIYLGDKHEEDFERIEEEDEVFEGLGS